MENPPPPPPPPPPPLKAQCIKNEEGTKAIAKTYCPSLQDDRG
jgi:hypothetical protein